MEYQLAKELKDAGFPQEDKHWYWSDHTLPITHWDVNALDKIDEEIPAAYLYADLTLEELIEGCGQGECEEFDLFHINNLQHSEWKAQKFINGMELLAAAIGSNPTEAVARLWLALKKVV